MSDLAPFQRNTDEGRSANAMVRKLRVLPPLLFALAVLPLLRPALADCVREVASGEVICGAGRCEADVKGTVFCAPSRYGTIVTQMDGIVCGMGQCLANARGDQICSSVEGGAVFADTKGIRCYGECEPASLNLCERTPAGW